MVQQERNHRLEQVDLGLIEMNWISVHVSPLRHLDKSWNIFEQKSSWILLTQDPLWPGWLRTFPDRIDQWFSKLGLLSPEWPPGVKGALRTWQSTPSDTVYRIMVRMNLYKMMILYIFCCYICVFAKHMSKQKHLVCKGLGTSSLD